MQNIPFFGRADKNNATFSAHLNS